MKLKILGFVVRDGKHYFSAYDEGNKLVEVRVLDDAVDSYKKSIGKGFVAVDHMGITEHRRITEEPVTSTPSSTLRPKTTTRKRRRK